MCASTHLAAPLPHHLTRAENANRFMFRPSAQDHSIVTRIKRSALVVAETGFAAAT